MIREDIGPPLELPLVEASYTAPYYTTVYDQPTDVKFDKATGAITWIAAVAFESGIQAFKIERNGQVNGQIPEGRVNSRGGRPLFQGLTHGDTPELPLLDFQFIDSAAKGGETHNYRVIAINSAGLQSN